MDYHINFTARLKKKKKSLSSDFSATLLSSTVPFCNGNELELHSKPKLLIICEGHKKWQVKTNCKTVDSNLGACRNRHV